MIVDHCKIEIEGQEAANLYDNLVSLEVELDEDLASMLRLMVIMPQFGADWSHLDDEQLVVWKKIKVFAGFEDDSEELFSGYITHIKPSFGPTLESCTLEVWGMDGSVLMDREEKLKDWPDKKDSDIATEIFTSYGFTPDVEDTEITHEEKVSTIMQCETDMQFLRRLAQRNGYDCYVQGNTAAFKPPQVDAEPQPLLAAHFGDETTLTRFSLEVNALAPVHVSMFAIDRVNKETLDVQKESSEQKTLGQTGASGMLQPGIDPALVFAGGNTALGLPQMTALSQGIYDHSEWFVTGEGEIAAQEYGHVLRPRGTVTIKGIGETHSGVYYVAHVTHSFTRESYTQHFRVKRNALKPHGSENFSGSAGGLLGLL